MSEVVQSRYVVGIDLGTTNSALAFVDTKGMSDDAPPVVEMFQVPQVVRPGAVEPRASLPSFLYLAGEGEFPKGALDLPWTGGVSRTFTVGEHARAHGWQSPARLVASAKSWLGHAGVDRTAAILPWGAGDDVAKLSPVDASARYLAHLKSAWDAEHRGEGLAKQEVLLTVPASFDAVARDLTVRAAREAGLEHVTLLEEPQAAFYSWIAHTGDGWRKALRVGDVVLVADVGGGTTDFSLVAVTEAGGDLQLERVAVGDHILLGGDNMDLALAYGLAQRLGERGTQLDAWQQRSLAHACRAAKESLLGDASKDSAPVTVLGRGSKVIGGSIKEKLERADVERVLVDGFFPACAKDEGPQKARRVGFQELGLPYAQDAAVTRHLAHFLTAHGKTPTALLFNGGVMKGTPLRARLAEVIASWNAGGAAPRALEGTDLDLAVAHGAAYYGLVRRGKGIRIRGGTARSYYVGIESAMPAVPGFAAPLKALCVAPFGMEEGSEADVATRDFALVVGQPVQFRFLSSTTRKLDKVGTLLDAWGEGELEELSPVDTSLAAAGGPPDTPGESGERVPVRVRAKVTEVGTLELWCVARDDAQRRWRLEYSLRAE